MTVEEALKIGRQIPSERWLDGSPLDEHEEALKVITEHLDTQKKEQEDLIETWAKTWKPIGLLINGKEI